MCFLRKIFLRALFFLFLFFLQKNSNAQVRNQETLVWSDLTLLYNFNDKVSYVGDAGLRYNLDTHLSVLFIRPTILWKMNRNLNATAGLAYFYPLDKSISNISDVRIFQSLELIWPRYKGFALHHRVLLEERWFYEDGSNTNFKIRSRYRFSVNSPHYALFGERKSNYNHIAVEFLGMLDTNNIPPLLNRRRYLFTYGHELSKSIALELHYQLHGLQDKLVQGFELKDSIFRISVKLKLNT